VLQPRRRSPWWRAVQRKSDISLVLVGSRASPWDAVLVGVHGVKLWTCKGDIGGIGSEGGAMRPSAL
jgi:hypothetical protein